MCYFRRGIHCSPLLPPLREETMAINLWHGCGAFKKFGRSTAELKFGASAATLDKYPNYGNLDVVTVSSPEVIWAYEQAMNLPKGIRPGDRYQPYRFIL